MTETIPMPPMPKVGDFIDSKGRVRRQVYQSALRTWKEIAHTVIEADKSNHFWAKK